MSDNNNNNTLGMIAPQVAGGVLGMALGGQTDKRQYDMANRVGRLNNILGMEMGNYNYNKQLQMWRATGPVGQMEQLKNAGLNPALMYGKSGPGGMLAAPATAGHANAGNANAGMEAGMGMQLATGLQQAQIENLKADTAKKQAEAEKTAGVDTEKVTWENKLLELEKNMKNDTYSAVVSKAKDEANQAMHQARIMWNEATISDMTWSAKEQLINNEFAMIPLKKAAMEAGINLTTAEAKATVASITQAWAKIKQGDKQLTQGEKHIEIDKERNKLIDKGIEWGAAARVISDVISIATPKKAGAVINNTRNVSMDNRKQIFE